MHDQLLVREVDRLFHEGGPDLVEVDDALQRLSADDPELGRVVELRFFGGLSLEETGKVPGSSTATVTRAWRVARLWLARELGDAPDWRGRQLGARKTALDPR